MNSGKHLLHVLHTESIYSRGGEKYLYELLSRMATSTTVRLYLHAISPEWKQLYGAAHITNDILWKPKRFFWLLLPVTVFVNYWQLKRVVAKRDVVFATSFPMNFLAVLVSRNTVCHCAEPLPIFYDSVRISSLPKFSQLCVRTAKIMYRGLDRWAYQQCAVLTTLNRSVEKYILTIYKKKPDMFLSNGVDANRFSPSSLGKKRNYFHIGHSTDYTVFKGTQNFLALLKELHAHRVPFRADISESIADPHIKKEYQSYINKAGMGQCVRFIGSLSEKNLVTFYRGLDLFIFTGSPKGSGAAAASMSVLEAQSCSVPVIRSFGDDQELIGGKTGYYINPYDSVTSSKAVMKFFSLPKQTVLRMKKNARAYVLNRFSWEATHRELLRALQAAKNRN